MGVEAVTTAYGIKTLLFCDVVHGLLFNQDFVIK